MLGVDTFLTTLYVMLDDFCHSHLPKRYPGGPEASLSESELITLWPSLPVGTDSLASGISTATPRLTCVTLSPPCQRALAVQPPGTLPHRAHREEDGAAPGVRLLKAPRCPYEALESSAMPVREARSEGGLDGWTERPTHRMV
jgi:hypothetical protein